MSPTALCLYIQLGWKIFVFAISAIFVQYMSSMSPTASQVVNRIGLGNIFVFSAIFAACALFCTLPSSFLWVSQCKLMEILYLVHFYIILCRNIWAGLQTLWLFCFSFPYNIQIHIPGGANFQFRKFLCGTLNGILKPSQTRERYSRRPINFYRPISIPTGRNKKI